MGRYTRRKYGRAKRLIRRILGGTGLVAAAVALGIIYAVFFRPISGTNHETTGITPVTVPSADGLLSVSFIDVGQGDAALIEAPDGEFMLIDAGPPDYEHELLSYLDSLGVKKLTYIVFTHPHIDHIGGGDDVIEHCEVGTVIMQKYGEQFSAAKRLNYMLDKTKANISEPVPGSTYGFGGATLTILAPNSETYEQENDMSIVVRLEYGDISFLFTGDAEETSEREMLELWRDRLDCDVLKAGHHGSSSSSSEEFIHAVSPVYAVISCGLGNDYNHPHPSTVRRLEDAGVTILRTDLLGTITLATDGKEIYYVS